MIPGTEHGSFDHVGVFLARLRLGWLLHHFSPCLVWAAYVCVNCFITIALLALLAFLTDSPFVFPSLGPTAYYSGPVRRNQPVQCQRQPRIRGANRLCDGEPGRPLFGHSLRDAREASFRGTRGRDERPSTCVQNRGRDHRTPASGVYGGGLGYVRLISRGPTFADRSALSVLALFKRSPCSN